MLGDNVNVIPRVNNKLGDDCYDDERSACCLTLPEKKNKQILQYLICVSLRFCDSARLTAQGDFGWILLLIHRIIDIVCPSNYTHHDPSAILIVAVHFTNPKCRVKTRNFFFIFAFFFHPSIWLRRNVNKWRWNNESWQRVRVGWWWRKVDVEWKDVKS